MKGYELIKEIENGNIDNCKIKWSNAETKGTIEIKNRKLEWKTGTFDTSILTDNCTTFKVEGIMELNLKGVCAGEKIDKIENKVNEIIRILNKEGKNEDLEEFPF